MLFRSPRVTDGYLWVRSRISGVDSYNRYKLTGADVETVDVALYAATNRDGSLTGVDLVEWTVIDGYENSNWVGAGTNGERTDRSTCQNVAGFTIRDVGTSKNQQVWNEDTYPHRGIIMWIYEQLVERETTGNAMSLTAAHVQIGRAHV